MQRTKLGWCLAAILFLLSVGGVMITTSMQPVPAMAQEEQSEVGQYQGEVGRYQISAWGAHSGARLHSSGYYLLDTVTGKIVDKGHEIYGIDSPAEVE